MSGGVTAPVVVSTLVDMLDLSTSIDASTSLLSAYETTISSKFNEVEQFEILIMTYTTIYDDYIGVLAGHTGHTKSYLITYIENEYNRSQGIQHKDSSPSNKHGILAIRKWGVYDKTFPSYPCDGACTESFMTPTSAHEINCGGPDDPTRNKFIGCSGNYYNCDPLDIATHTPGPCVTKIWYRTWNRGPNGESVPVWGIRDCGITTRDCIYHPGGHASPAEPGNNNFSMMHTTQRNDDDDDNIEQTPIVDNSPDCDSCTTGECSSCPITFACGVHTGIAASEASNHEWGTAPCGDDTHIGYLCQINDSDHEWVYASCPSLHAHYECDGSDHSFQASCSETNANGDSCTGTSFYACQSHTHQYPAPTVACGARSWTNCTAQVNSNNEHHVTSCSNCSRPYWSCNLVHGAIKHEVTHTCSRSGCGQSFTECSRGNGTCSGGQFTWHQR